MIEQIICHNCHTSNNFVNLHCSNCKHLIRDRVINIDLWSSIMGSIDSPSEMFKKVVLAEHKNFILVLFILISLRHAISGLLISPYIGIISIQYYAIRFIASTVLILILYITLSKTTQQNVIKEITTFKLKDAFAIILYGQTPIIFSLVILFLFEIILFGEYLFSIQPSPLEIKPMFFYLFLTLEITVLIWTILLSFLGFRKIGINKIVAFLYALIVVVGSTTISLLTFF